ncbi:unnamed protein product [Linum trigynum]|uniref:Uncharacterized protein n=1 Tax=Linum trigynum TaxID=586398 RepID=A0AAV2E2A9_9ROSI
MSDAGRRNLFELRRRPRVSVHLLPKYCSHGNSLAAVATQKNEKIESREAKEDGGGNIAEEKEEGESSPEIAGKKEKGDGDCRDLRNIKEEGEVPCGRFVSSQRRQQTRPTVSPTGWVH